MDILELLKQFKNIEPNRIRAEESKFLILNSPAGQKTSWFSPWRMILNTLEVGSATALAGFVLIIIFSGFGTFRSVSPIKLSGLDKASLRAEAEAIDIQIQLTNLNYPEIPTMASANSTQPTAVKISTTTEKSAIISEKSVQNTGIENPTSTPELSIDEALSKLAE